MSRVEVQAARLGRVVEGLDFEEFFQNEYRGLVRTLHLLTADQSEAEELAQETMARIYERWDRVSGMESPGGYAYRLAINLNRQRLRHGIGFATMEAPVDELSRRVRRELERLEPSPGDARRRSGASGDGNATVG